MQVQDVLRSVVSLKLSVQSSNRLNYTGSLGSNSLNFANIFWWQTMQNSEKLFLSLSNKKTVYIWVLELCMLQYSPCINSFFLFSFFFKSIFHVIHFNIDKKNRLWLWWCNILLNHYKGIDQYLVYNEHNQYCWWNVTTFIYSSTVHEYHFAMLLQEYPCSAILYSHSTLKANIVLFVAIHLFDNFFYRLLCRLPVALNPKKHI